jgi:polyhydroxyalkanoate synthesis regulator phasin
MASTAHLIDQLVSDGILNPDDSVEIMSNIVPSEMNRRLIGKIRDKNQYDKFIAALREDSVNAELADDIEQTDVTEHDMELLHSKKGVYIYVT